MTHLPSPRARLADCCWLPRIAAKARQLLAGELGEEYVARFCDRDSVDEHFLQSFGLTKADFLAGLAQAADDQALEQWFRTQPGVTDASIGAWNELARNLGRPGYPMEARRTHVLKTIYASLDPTGLDTIFDLIEADERPK